LPCFGTVFVAIQYRLDASSGGGDQKKRDLLHDNVVNRPVQRRLRPG
jgi:hypothetical protein